MRIARMLMGLDPILDSQLEDLQSHLERIEVYIHVRDHFVLAYVEFIWATSSRS